jgi:intermediate cleaving peptidase 55
MTMFGLPKNPSIELWDGPRTGLDGIIEKFGADEAYTSMQFSSRLREAINKSKCIYVDTNMSSGSILSASEPAQKLISNGTTADWSNWQEGGVAGLLAKMAESLNSYGKDSGICELAPTGRETGKGIVNGRGEQKAISYLPVDKAMDTFSSWLIS